MNVISINKTMTKASKKTKTQTFVFVMALKRTLLYSVIESTNDAEHLQSDLSTIEYWSQKWLMQFNPSKCFVMRITRKRDPVIYDYKLMGHSLESVSQHPYLGLSYPLNQTGAIILTVRLPKQTKLLDFCKEILATALNQLKNQLIKHQ